VFDVILSDAIAHTQHEARRTAHAVVLEGGPIRVVGTAEALSDLTVARHVDVAGKELVPGSL